MFLKQPNENKSSICIKRFARLSARKSCIRFCTCFRSLSLETDLKGVIQELVFERRKQDKVYKRAKNGAISF